jgi:hypothetical protein
MRIGMGQAQEVEGIIMEEHGNKRGMETVLKEAEGRLCLIIYSRFRNATG